MYLVNLNGLNCFKDLPCRFEIGQDYMRLWVLHKSSNIIHDSGGTNLLV